ncbi:hypothetical protein DM02DRAFT_612756 [Periconia macrospinosa]|uniref:Ubiquitin-like domain-containing protein n=1 Tax=Periconia macrospinosa TaxID=97972 RepID=A0A2V1DX82_9PLEO|nr:hypothetical protein DM02DRAFT_612756 [Periconia macrospinosa]
MSEVTFCKQYLSALDGRPVKLSSDHIADARQYPPGAVFTLPRLAHPPHPQRPNPSSTSTASTNDASATSTSSNSATTISISLKPLKPSTPTIPLSNISAAKTSIYDLKTAYATATSLPAGKIKILFKKKPVGDSKTVAEVVGDADAGSEVEFGVMVMGGATAAGVSSSSSPVASPPAVAPTEAEKGLGGGGAAGETSAPAAQGPSGKEVVASEAFWEDLHGFIVQRIRDEKEGGRLVGVFREAWEKSK